MAKKSKKAKRRSVNRYSALLRAIFRAHYRRGSRAFSFRRSEIEKHAAKLRIPLPKNLGDLIYTFRYRQPLPDEITATAPEGAEWIIAPGGVGIYRFRLTKVNRIRPADNQYIVKIPDATPEIVTRYAMSDEQALLAKVRYNRLVDVFLRVTAYSLQSHLRTTAPAVGQMETDELYVGLRNTGEQFIIPVQAKGKKDQIGVVQVGQDIAMCRHRFPKLTCRPVAVQFTEDAEEGEVIAMFELTDSTAGIRVVDQKQYRLVPGDDVTDDDLDFMARSS